MAVVIAAALCPSTFWNSKYTLHAAHGRADAKANCATDHAADRSGGAIAVTVTLVGTLLTTPENALRLRKMRHGDQSQHTGGECQAGLH